MALRIGIPLFDDEVSPRFCFAESMLVVTVAEDGAELSRETVSLGSTWFPDRLALVAARGIAVVVCGGFNAAFLPQAEQLGIRVISGIAGDAEQALARFLAGELVSRRRCGSPTGRRRRRGS
ncbi:MAG: NifB/NifX family molybdenum-iron cluster-binding protein [Myxococcales bacterium]